MDGAVFLEIRERTQSGLLIIRQLKPESWPADITVLPSLLELKSGGGSKSIPLPPEVRIVPSSCRGLQYVPGDGLHMRLRVQADCSKSKTDLLLFLVSYVLSPSELASCKESRSYCEELSCNSTEQCRTEEGLTFSCKIGLIRFHTVNCCLFFLLLASEFFKILTWI
uniref:Uncharacterized protein n=1 Tax=Varanus komodoensis TaxID=61221 RepID=A0A8D2Q9Q7_VARKO